MAKSAATPNSSAASALSSAPRGHAGRFGRFGEECAAQWYVEAGYTILDRNWRCRHGELDLVVAKGSTVVFVEVKSRSSNRFGSGAEAVDWRKQSRIRILAGRWLESAGATFDELRFDVVDVDRRGTLQLHHDCF